MRTFKSPSTKWNKTSFEYLSETEFFPKSYLKIKESFVFFCNIFIGKIDRYQTSKILDRAALFGHSQLSKSSLYCPLFRLYLIQRLDGELHPLITLLINLQIVHTTSGFHAVYLNLNVILDGCKHNINSIWLHPKSWYFTYIHHLVINHNFICKQIFFITRIPRCFSFFVRILSLLKKNEFRSPCLYFSRIIAAINNVLPEPVAILNRICSWLLSSREWWYK